jgi:hypothetical protein
LGRSSLTKLDVSNNQITVTGITALADALSSLNSKCSLRSLVLASNSIGDVGADILAKAGSSDFVQLMVLDVSRNGIAGQGASSLLGACGSSSCCGELTDLVLLGNELGDVGVGLLCLALSKGCSKLLSLDLTGTNITTGCLDALLAAVEKSNIKSLALGGNKVGVAWKELQAFTKKTGVDVVFDQEPVDKDQATDAEPSPEDLVPTNQMPPQWTQHGTAEVLTCPVDVSHLNLGDAVIIRRLANATKYNDMRGIVSSGLLNGRISVWVEGEQKSIAVKPENIDKA